MGAVSARQVKIQGGFKHSLSSPGPEINEKNTFVVLKYYLKKKIITPEQQMCPIQVAKDSKVD